MARIAITYYGFRRMKSAPGMFPDVILGPNPNLPPKFCSVFWPGFEVEISNQWDTAFHASPN